MKKIFIDIKTTGLDPQRNGIIQIGTVIIDHTPRTSSPYGPGSSGKLYDIQPFPDDEIDINALAAIGLGDMTQSDLLDSRRKTPQSAKLGLLEEMKLFVDQYDPRDKFQFYAYNAQFDSNFLRAWFRKLDDQYFGSWFWTPPIDIMSLAADHIGEERPSLANFQLTTVAEWFGIEVDYEKAHSALYDAELARGIYNKIKDS